MIVHLNGPKVSHDISRHFEVHMANAAHPPAPGKPPSMQAMIQDSYGSPAVVRARNVARPVIGDQEVLIEVRAAGVNPADWAIMGGLPYIARPVYGLRKPKQGVRGTDVAGVVATVGAGVTLFKAGDEVFGSSDGSYAEYSKAPQNALALKPANLSFEQAAAVPMAGTVALQAIRDRGKVRAGHTVLVNGAAGGIGTFAVQIAKALGAHVTAVASTRNLDLLRSLGADAVIDYTKEDFTRSGRRYQLILDNVSNHSLTALRRALTPTGMLIPNGGNFGNRWLASGGRIARGVALFKFGDQSLGNFLVSMNREDLIALKALIEAGKVTPIMDRIYALSDASKALAHVGGGHLSGKVAISMTLATAGPEEMPATWRAAHPRATPVAATLS
jgi:NADPH:quinone reductase-like Zn-dependent oxidoreductase